MKLRKTTPAGITGHYSTTVNGTLYEIQRCDKGSDLDDGHHIVGFWYVTDFSSFAYEARTLAEAKEGIQLHERAKSRSRAPMNTEDFQPNRREQKLLRRLQLCGRDPVKRGTSDHAAALRLERHGLVVVEAASDYQYVNVRKAV